jgi:hypothetical protein
MPQVGYHAKLPMSLKKKNMEVCTKPYNRVVRTGNEKCRDKSILLTTESVLMVNTSDSPALGISQI